MRTNGPLVVVPCSGKKATHPAPARDLYLGSLYRLAMAAAVEVTAPWRVVILSARHGFVRLTTVLEPYDTTWDDDDAADEELLADTAASLDASDGVVLLLPTAYAHRALQVWPDAAWPLRGCAGIGEMRQRLARIRDGGLDALRPVR